jgi:hypothetical protein
MPSETEVIALTPAAQPAPQLPPPPVSSNDWQTWARWAVLLLLTLLNGWLQQAKTEEAKQEVKEAKAEIKAAKGK